jgi:hypothetical protein
MPDYLTLWAGAATIGCAGLTYLWLSTRIDRDESQFHLRIMQDAKDGLANRVSTLRGDNADLQRENIALSRELGRMQAEQRATKPKRGANGKFVAKTKANA